MYFLVIEPYIVLHCLRKELQESVVCLIGFEVGISLNCCAVCLSVIVSECGMIWCEEESYIVCCYVFKRL